MEPGVHDGAQCTAHSTTHLSTGYRLQLTPTDPWHRAFYNVLYIHSPWAKQPRKLNHQACSYYMSTWLNHTGNSRSSLLACRFPSLVDHFGLDSQAPDTTLTCAVQQQALIQHDQAPRPWFKGTRSAQEMSDDDYKLWSCVSIATSSSLDGRSVGESERQTIAILMAISISSSSPSSPRMLLSSAAFGSADCCICRSHLARPPCPASPEKKESVGSLPVSSTPRIMPRA